MKFKIFITIMMLIVVYISPIITAQVKILGTAEYDRINIRTPQAIQVRLEQLQGSKDFERVYNFKKGSRFHRISQPVGRLKIKVKDQENKVGMFLCTASIISENYILTNYHCIPGQVGMKVLEAKLELGYLHEIDTSTVSSFNVDPVAEESNANLDYAIVRVQGNPSKTYGNIDISADNIFEKDAVFIIHHPEGSPKTLSRKQCFITSLKGPDITHSCDTMPGSSGSPVFSDETYQVVGLHFAGSSQGNVGTTMTGVIEQSPILQGIIALKSEKPQPKPVKVVKKVIQPLPTKKQDNPSSTIDNATSDKSGSTFNDQIQKVDQLWDAVGDDFGE
jgi:hypothetical protein